MAIAGVTNATVVTDTILTEHIMRAMRMAVSAPFLFQDFVFMPDTLQNTKRWAVPIFARLNPASAYTESDTVAAQALTPTAVNIDTTMWATGGYLGDWAAALSTIPLIPGMVQALMDAGMQRLENDALGLVSQMTNSIGSAANEFNTDLFVLAASRFRTQAKRSSRKPLMVLSESAKRDLQADVMANGGSIYASPVGVGLYQAVSSANQGEWVDWGGFMIASTDAVADVGSAKGNFIVHMTPQEFALGLAFSLAMRIEPARKAEAVGLYLIYSDAHGQGVCEQARALRVLSKAA